MKEPLSHDNLMALFIDFVFYLKAHNYKICV